MRNTLIALSVNMIFPTKMVLPMLLLIISGDHLTFVQDGISDFLEHQGLKHLAAAFISKEIEVRQIPSIPDNFLVELGVRTMGES